MVLPDPCRKELPLKKKRKKVSCNQRFAQAEHSNIWAKVCLQSKVGAEGWNSGTSQPFNRKALLESNQIPLVMVDPASMKQEKYPYFLVPAISFHSQRSKTVFELFFTLFLGGSLSPMIMGVKYILSSRVLLHPSNPVGIYWLNFVIYNPVWVKDPVLVWM